jgi:hypothetical protein
LFTITLLFYINDVQKLVRERTTGIYNLGEAEARVRDRNLKMGAVNRVIAATK